MIDAESAVEAMPLSPNEAAPLMGFSDGRPVKRLIKQGVLLAFKHPTTGYYLIEPADIQAYKDRNRVKVKRARIYRKRR